MAVDIAVVGLDDLGKLSNALKKAGHGGLRKELHRGVNRATKEPKAAAKAQAAAFLPDRYATVLIPNLRFRTRVRGDGVSIITKAKGRPRDRHVGAINRGRLRHPTYGNRNAWVNQGVRPGFVTIPMQSARPEMRREIKQAMDRVADQIVRG